MDVKARVIAMAGLLAVYCSPALGQATILVIDVENFSNTRATFLILQSSPPIPSARPRCSQEISLWLQS
jgi:hypothetical protein